MLTQELNDLLKHIERLSPDFFYFKSNSLLYRAILETINPIDKISLANFLSMLNTKNLVTQLGKLETIIKLIDRSPTSNIIYEYSTVILDNYIKRLLLKSGDALCLISCSREPIMQNSITSATNQLTMAYEVLEDKETNNLAKTFAKLLVNLDTKKKVSISNSIFSGFSKLDLITNGFQKSDLIIIAGRPSMGKTAFAINITRNIIKTSQYYVILFSLEMSTEQLLRRILAQECHLNSQKIQSGKLTNIEWQNVVDESKILANLNFYIDDSAEISCDIIKTKVKLLKLQGKKIELIIIDYLQLLQDSRESNNRSQELSLITRSLKILARELDLPILVLSQLNRNLESRHNKRPLLSDLRESGCISKFNYIMCSQISKPFFDFSIHKSQVYNFNKKINQIFGIGKAYVSRQNRKTTYKVRTNSDKYLELTSNHKILTLRGWQRCDQILCNDMITTQLQFKLNKRKQYLLNCLSFSLCNFEPLITIRISKFENVFDFTTYPIPNFIANNIIVHNSIEQDADLVIMLYRESYYNKEIEMEDMTEIIVAKHRNGPLGTFQLKFDSNLANFLNV
ncbi:replication helicase subunit (chloroplast) [Porphyra umbilicalis]|uniref:Replicative DNA helicase n=1 Tax=Porphyra umbilicalis TaxID=2786 RepID=J7F5R4_PORUM|nr:replication helicase subunit [Porphyra umbilicalis]AFC40001.1 replication helicase subunit [Porphyra umbilicalis]ASN78805.1 replication helicase subunit [Porphyra umbilicalis]|eukprot:ASN78805.1 replication helicase subunit (chloroplast) [Porphyra umbilicalis]